MTSAVSRLAVAVVAPENDNTPGWTEFCSGPYDCQWLLLVEVLLLLAAVCVAILLNVFFAFCTIDGGITLAG